MTKNFQYYHDGEFIEYDLPIDDNLITYNPFDDLTVLYYLLSSAETLFKRKFPDSTIDEVIRLRLSDLKVAEIKLLRRIDYEQFGDPLYMAWLHEVYVGTEESANKAFEKWQTTVNKIKEKYQYSVKGESTYSRLLRTTYDTSIDNVNITE